MVIEGPLAPNFFYEYLILVSTIFPRENYKKLGLTPRECPLLGLCLGLCLGLGLDLCLGLSLDLRLSHKKSIGLIKN